MPSLQEQLLKAGLVDKNQSKKTLSEKHKAKKKTQKAGKKHKPQTFSSRSDSVMQKNAERDRVLNQQRQQAANQKAVTAQIKQLVDVNRVIVEEGEVAYHFAYMGKIKTIYITEELKRQLGNGYLAIVKLDVNPKSGFGLVPAAAARKIAERDPNLVVDISTDNEASQSDEDDPYKDFKVPDDLVW